jgi:hypothetical protein
VTRPVAAAEFERFLAARLVVPTLE